MKKILRLLIVSTISCIKAEDILSKDQKISMNNQFRPDQVVIAFDLHEVVFNFSYSKFFGSTYKFFKKNPYALTLANPFAGYRVVNTFFSTSKTAENIYTQLSEKYYPWLAESKIEFINVCNSYILEPEMEKLLTELKAKGYRLAVCSNIGYQAFEQFKREHPNVFDLFEVIVTSHPERNYLRKPAPEFFDHFKADVAQVVQDPDITFLLMIKREILKLPISWGLRELCLKMHYNYEDHCTILVCR